MTRTQGRILAYLTIAEDRLQTLESIANYLNLGVSTVSPELKLLVDLNLASRQKKKDLPDIEGDRGYVFHVSEDTWLNAIDDKGASSLVFVYLLSEGIKILEDEPAERSKLLIEMKHLFEFLAVEMPKLIEKYKAQKRNRINK